MNTIWLLKFIVIFVVISTTKGLGQIHDKKDVYFKDTTKTPLEFIAGEFYKDVQGLDTCCLTAFGSAKFIIHNNGKIDSVWISVGIPKYIATYLEAAIYSSATYWEINKKYKSISIIIPLFIAPSNLCDKENIKDDVLASAANMFTYQGGHKRVKRHDYFRKAEGTEDGIILSPLLIKGQLNDVFIDIFNAK